MSTLLLFISLLPVISIAFLKDLKALEARIVNGIPTLALNYPFIVDIRNYYPDYNSTGSSFCTGSLIQLQYPATILTAGHCLYNTTNDLAVYLLRSDQDAAFSSTNNFTFYPVWKYVLHENYDHSTLDNDIGLIFLDEDVSDNERLTAVTLQNLDYNTECCSNNEALQVIGYGVDSEGGNATDTLEYTNKAFLERDECQQRFVDYFEYLHIYYSNYTYNNSNRSVDIGTPPDVNHNMICAIGDDTDSCQGDSGGPLIKTGTTTQVGVTSFGHGCNRGIPGVYTNLGVYYSWIMAHEDVTVVAVDNTTLEDDDPDGAVSYYDMFLKLSIWMMLYMYII